MEADFQAVYRLDLRAVVWGPDLIGCRRLLALVQGLPAGSLTAGLMTPAAAKADQSGERSNRMSWGDFARRMTGRR